MASWQLSKRHKQLVQDSIDWSAVLGPVLCAATVSPSGLALQADELDDLERGTFAHVRRAVRPRPGLAAATLPFETDRVPWFPRGRFVSNASAVESVRPGAFLQYAAGDYYIQDAGSMLALALLDAQPGDWVCDTCAAPGGKSTGLLEQLAGRGVLVANEVIRSRLSLLKLALERAGYGNHMVTNLELEQLSQLCGPAFDRVLVDAPCTGQTMVGRGKQRVAAFSAAQIAHSSARQDRILRAAAGLVKPAGRLVYSTCAYSFAENEQVVMEFVQAQPGWQLQSQSGFEAWASPLCEGCYRVWPHRHGCSGAFAAVLVNQSGDSAQQAGELARQSPATLRGRYGWRELECPPQDLQGLVAEGEGRLWLGGNQLHRFDASLPDDWIGSAVAGTELASRSGELHSQRWTPSFGGAVLVGARQVPPLDLGESLGELALEDAQAIRYVAGESLRQVSATGGARSAGGWCVATWRGRRLGWGKLAGGILKNHFPKAIRQANAVCQ